MSDTKIKSKKKIERLTPEQKSRFAEFRDEWIRIGLCTDPADRPVAEAAIAQCYRIAGLDPPCVVWTGSPFSQALTRAVVLSLFGIDCGDSVSASVKSLVVPSVSASVEALTRSSVRELVGRLVWASVRNLVLGSVRDSVRASVGESVGGLVRELTEQWIYGQHDADFLAYYAYFSEVCGLQEETRPLEGLWALARSAHWCLPYRHICWVSERPNGLWRDELGRLHRTDGPALTYPDGWSIWSIGGVLVDEQVVMRPETQALDQIRNERDAEVRRIRIERYGWMRYLKEMDAVVVDTRTNDIESTVESLMRTPTGETVLVCACPSTARCYSLEVPPGIHTCESAQGWLSGGLSGRVIHAF